MQSAKQAAKRKPQKASSQKKTARLVSGGLFLIVQRRFRQRLLFHFQRIADKLTIHLHPWHN